ncbi:MAG: Serine hydrolase [Deltaproteobacteria bacterium]|nr:Serine hydrolase [Deltaproteobacteria bacterium]
MDFHSVEAACQDAVAQGVFPGAVLLIAKEQDIVFEQAFGQRSLAPDQSPLRVDTIFDIASLTKPLATTTAIMLLVREKKIRLDDQITRVIPMYGVLGKSLTTFRHLLTHCGGLLAWKPFFEEIIKSEKAGRLNFTASRAAKSYVYEQIHRDKPVSAPGNQSLYSDLGFMILGEAVEILTGNSLDRFCQERIFKPMGMRATGFVDLTQLRTRRLQPITEIIAPTENCPWRKKILCGEVHDDNAYAMGGVAGHAGLFSSARDIHAFLLRLDQCRKGKDNFLPQLLVEEFLTKDQVVSRSTFALGWDTPTPGQSSSGSLFSSRSVGHLGFTGCSIWWDLEKNCHVVLLTNRIHPTRKNEKIKEFRPLIHDLIMNALFA